jgi:hypothetical protein
MTKQYRAKPYDILHDIWLLQKRFLWIFWRSISVGQRGKVEAKVAELNGEIKTGARGQTPDNRLEAGSVGNSSR